MVPTLTVCSKYSITFCDEALRVWNNFHSAEQSFKGPAENSCQCQALSWVKQIMHKFNDKAPLLFQVRIQFCQMGKAQLIRAEPSVGIGCLLNRGISLLLLFHRQKQTAMQSKNGSLPVPHELHGGSWSPPVGHCWTQKCSPQSAVESERGTEIGERHAGNGTHASCITLNSSNLCLLTSMQYSKQPKENSIAVWAVVPLRCCGGMYASVKGVFTSFRSAGQPLCCQRYSVGDVADWNTVKQV